MRRRAGGRAVRVSLVNFAVHGSRPRKSRSRRRRLTRARAACYCPTIINGRREDLGGGVGRRAGMLIGKRGAAATAIAEASAARVTVRGRDLSTDLMGRATFTEYFFLLATGRAPSDEQR